MSTRKRGKTETAPNESTPRNQKRKYERTDHEVLDEESRLRIFKTPKSPNWYVEFPLPARRHFKRSLKTKNRKEARRRAWKKYNDFQSGKTGDVRKAAPKIQEAIDTFLANKLRVGKKENTVVEYRRALRQFQQFMLQIGIVRMDRVMPDHLERFENQLRKGGVAVPRKGSTRGARSRRNKGATIREKVKLVKGLFKWCVRRKKLKENPVEGYELPADTDPNNYCFTTEEVSGLCMAATPFFADVFRFLALTGLRQGELFWLTKDDVDPERRLVHVRAKAFSEEGLSWSPKNGDRRVPLCQEAMEIAQRMLKTSWTRWLFSAPGSEDGRL